MKTNAYLCNLRCIHHTFSLEDHSSTFWSMDMRSFRRTLFLFLYPLSTRRILSSLTPFLESNCSPIFFSSTSWFFVLSFSSFSILVERLWRSAVQHPKISLFFKIPFLRTIHNTVFFFILLSILGEHYTIQPHFSDSQYSYLTIKDINMNHTKKIVNLYGIIVSASRPLKNNRISFFPLSTRRERVQCQVPYSRSLFWGPNLFGESVLYFSQFYSSCTCIIFPFFSPILLECGRHYSISSGSNYKV